MREWVSPGFEMKVSAVVITLNEERHLAACLESLRFCDEIVVVDAASTDRTAEIAARFTPRVYTRAFSDFSSQKNFGMAMAEGPWILSVDADERVSDELREEILGVVRNGGGDVSGYALKRWNFIFGRHLKHGGHEKDYPLRFIRKGRFSFEGPIHESLKPENAAHRLSGILYHDSTENASAYLRKLNLYTGLEADRLRRLGRRPRIPELFARPLGRFFERYLFRLGFLDGFEGFVFYLLSGYYDFVRYAKCREGEDAAT